MVGGNNMFNWFKKKITKRDAVDTSTEDFKLPPMPKAKAPVKSDKEIATEKGEPWVNILSMEIDPENMQNGAFELDWNDKFVANLVRAGYQMNPKDTDSDIVDRWFTAVCRNIVLETYEQYQAMDPERDRVVKTRNIGEGRSEVS
jgi:hypothetical protein